MNKKPNLSLIIPHKNRPGMLKKHLDALEHQTLRNFEVIVVDDGSDVAWNHHATIMAYHDPESMVIGNTFSDIRGPNAARNTGAALAKSDILLFVGDDCIPDRNLLFRHYVMHQIYKGVAVQGYSPFHPQVMGSEFMQWLNNSGLQANWNSLRNDDGSAKEQVDGYCLTTNFSVTTQTFHNAGRFDARNFDSPAWDDVSFGYMLNAIGVSTRFDPLAINHHFHEYDFAGFAKRQYMVGENIPDICLKHSEMSINLLSPEQLRNVRNESLEEWVHRIREIQFARLALPELNQIKADTWAQGILVFMIKGLLDELDRRGGAWRIFEHLHNVQTVRLALEGINGIRDDNYGWAMHCVEWIISDSPDNWAVYCYAAELYKHFGLREEAIRLAQRSLEIAPNDWATMILTME